jgi:hypothetical protein
MITIAKEVAYAPPAKFWVIHIVTNILSVMPATTTFLILAATH